MAGPLHDAEADAVVVDLQAAEKKSDQKGRDDDGLDESSDVEVVGVAHGVLQVDPH